MCCKWKLPVPVISQSVMQLFASRDNEKNWARSIALVRHGFGGRTPVSFELVENALGPTDCNVQRGGNP